MCLFSCVLLFETPYARWDTTEGVVSASQDPWRDSALDAPRATKGQPEALACQRGSRWWGAFKAVGPPGLAVNPKFFSEETEPQRQGSCKQEKSKPTAWIMAPSISPQPDNLKTGSWCITKHMWRSRQEVSSLQTMTSPKEEVKVLIHGTRLPVKSPLAPHGRPGDLSHTYTQACSPLINFLESHS